MSVVVQKYGGSSVATAEHLKRVARRVAATRAAGHAVVVVVSAMGDTTNQLLALAASVSPDPQRRELDMLITTGERMSMALLSMAIHDLGLPAVSFTGSQSGIITTHNHSDARILRVTPVRIQRALDAGQIVIVAGFQGVSEQLEITSLGRGGSDTTAVALAAALGAEYAEICSDVDGVYSADPRIVPGAQRIEALDYDQMQVLADAGAKVLNAEAVEWARRNRVEVRCVATEGPPEVGTRIRASGGLHQPRVVAVTAHPGLLVLGPSQPGAPAPADLEATLAAFGATDAEVWRMPDSFGARVPKQNLHGLAAFQEAMRGLGVQVRADLTLLTAVGRGLLGPPALLGPAREALAEAGITPHGQLADPGRLAFLVDAHRAADGVRALHAALIGGAGC